jgi:hypothetical protein
MYLKFVAFLIGCLAWFLTLSTQLYWFEGGLSWKTELNLQYLLKEEKWIEFVVKPTAAAADTSR